MSESTASIKALYTGDGKEETKRQIQDLLWQGDEDKAASKNSAAPLAYTRNCHSCASRCVIDGVVEADGKSEAVDTIWGLIEYMPSKNGIAVAVGYCPKEGETAHGHRPQPSYGFNDGNPDL